MRLIDADALWMEIIHTMDYCDDILEIIEHQKTIEPTHLNDSNTLKALDCIGRQEAIDAMYALVDGCERNDPYKENPHIDAIIDTLENLPPAQPKTGRWINKSVSGGDDIEEWQECQCSECKRWDTRPYMYYFDEPRFCSFCGAKMQKGEQA